MRVSVNWLERVEGSSPIGSPAPCGLCRLRYGGSAHLWGFGIYRASHDDYEDSYLPTGTTVGTTEEALDCACGLYHNNPLVWPPDTPTNERAVPPVQLPGSATMPRGPDVG